MSSSLNNKVAIVTGGTSGIGKESAIALAEAGAKVVVAGRRQSEGDAVVQQIKDAGGEALFVQTDVSDEAQVKALVDQAVATYGQVDIAFNNAGIEGAAGPLHEMDVANYDQVVDINVKGVLLSMKHQLQAMLQSGGGSIINNASIAAMIGFPGVSAYAASKHAVLGFTRTAALEYAQQGVRINAVSPGAIETDMFERFTGNDADTQAQLAAMHPVGRLGKSREIADVVVFLAGEGASFVTGQSFTVDGGFTAQ